MVDFNTLINGTVERQVDVELSPEQAGAMATVQAGHNVLITGPAGTGKSTLLTAIRQKWAMPVVASTGIAAVNVGGMTIHSWAGLGLGEGTPEKIANQILTRNAMPLVRIKMANRLAIDEISMISARLFNTIDKVFRIVRKNDRPFGGIQLVLFGDFLQLPPVITDEEEKEGRFCFESASWSAAHIQLIQLTKIFRQADGEFATALNELRFGRVSETTARLLRGRFNLTPPPTVKPVQIHTHRREVDQLNQEELDRLEGVPKTFTAIDEGTAGGLRTLQKNCLAPAELTLKVGAQVMLLKNLNTDLGLCNGAIGRVVALNGWPTVEFAQSTLELQRDTWEIKDGDSVLAIRKQVPLRLAWAITTHKSQGMTIDAIEVHLSKTFECGQAYVALSRVRTLDGLYIKSGGRNSISADPRAIEFYK